MQGVVPVSEPPARFPWFSLVTGIPCAVIPFLLCVTGYGAYLRMTWIIAIPALIGVGIVALYVVRASRNLLTGRFNAQISSKQDKILTLIFLGLAILSWISGKQVRMWHCESICARAAPLIEGLRNYQAEHGSYPRKLQDLPDFNRLAEAGKLSIREGRFSRYAWDVGFLELSDMTIYLEPANYWCVVPLEKKILMSFTRFYILRRDSTSTDWTEDHIIWSLSGL